MGNFLSAYGRRLHDCWTNLSRCIVRHAKGHISNSEDLGEARDIEVLDVKEGVILKTISLRKNFGSLVALDGVNLEVEHGKITSIIGLNGAGKTTLFNVITGLLRPTEGKVIFEGRDITNYPPHKIVKLGISRTFQITNVFAGLSVYDNVVTSFQVSRGLKLSSLLSEFKREKEIIDILETLDLNEKKDASAGDLSYGEQRRLEVAIALASNPKLLLMDEPTGGMTPLESLQIMDLIKKLRESLELTIIFIEHDMDIVMGNSDTITVMDEGKIICEGSPEKVKADEKVQAIYLGEKG